MLVAIPKLKNKNVLLSTLKKNWLLQDSEILFEYENGVFTSLPIIELLWKFLIILDKWNIKSW